MESKFLLFLVQKFSSASVGWEVQESEYCEEEGEGSFDEEEVFPGVEMRVLDSEDAEG